MVLPLSLIYNILYYMKLDAMTMGVSEPKATIFNKRSLTIQCRFVYYSLSHPSMRLRAMECRPGRNKPPSDLAIAVVPPLFPHVSYRYNWLFASFIFESFASYSRL
jgi:hypothetical protein